jgi:hypothetical protein
VMRSFCSWLIMVWISFFECSSLGSGRRDDYR